MFTLTPLHASKIPGDHCSCATMPDAIESSGRSHTLAAELHHKGRLCAGQTSLQARLSRSP